MIDKDKNGFLSREEIILAMGGAEENLYEQMLEECDLNKDGAISRDEFMEVMLNITESRIKANAMHSKSSTKTKDA